MAKYIDSSHNMLFKLNAAKWEPDLKKSGIADITGYQEAEGDSVRKTLTAFCKSNGRTLYHPKNCGNPISWKASVFNPVLMSDKPVHGVHDSHLGATAMGINAKFNPPRDFTWVGLVHVASKQRILRINVHPLAGGTDPTPEESPALSAWKDWGIGQYWLDVLAFTAGQMSIQNPGVKTTANFWDIITLGGDYNADFLNQKGDQWYYPNKLLPSLFVGDDHRAGLDHLQHTHGSDVKVLKRWTQEGNTDHKIHFIERQFTEIKDFPA